MVLEGPDEEMDYIVDSIRERLDSFIGSVDLITGALPAQYGLRTAGVLDIQTKADAFNNSGSVSVYGGSHGTITKMPQSPRITLGIAASISIKETIGCRSQSGASSVR